MVLILVPNTTTSHINIIITRKSKAIRIIKKTKKKNNENKKKKITTKATATYKLTHTRQLQAVSPVEREGPLYWESYPTGKRCAKSMRTHSVVCPLLCC